MTSIPANVQSFSAGNRTEQPKVQTSEPKEDFGKVLDRQKTSAPKESGVKTSKQPDKYADETAKTSERKDMIQESDVKATDQSQTENGEVQSDEAVSEQGQQVESAEETRQPEMAASGKEFSVEELPEEELELVIAILQSAVLQIRELLMEQLNISPQELEQLMQDGGFTDFQLLRPETVNQLILDATGAQDSLSLVVDENLYQSQKTIIQGFQEVTQGLEQELEDKGGLHKVLKSLEKPEGGIGIVDSRIPQEVRDTPESLRQESPKQQDGREHDGERGQNQSQGVTGQTLYQNYTAQAQNQALSQSSVSAANGGASYVETADSQQVMNQILDYMRVSMKPENTVLNMQLHPESLGTLHIQISAREGVMTAHFTASSEAVKTVLENQIAVLRENFEQQDIKVDAIEVTVESHQFESNLEQGRQRGEEEAGRRPKRRKLDISSLESGEELTESEQIITEMMAANGSSVDYLA